jgi:DNA-binding transcriptional ArsR family regulator
MVKEPASDVDYGSLADFLSALAYPTRLELLRILRFPQLASQIKVAPLRLEPGDNPQRSASKQTVQAHLDKLVDADLVRVEPAKEGGRNALVYTVNSQKVYAVTEDLRRLSALYAGRGGVGDFTGSLHASPAEEPGAKGARLTVVHGLYEGKSFHLDARSGPDGLWSIGRRRDAAIALDYDPYVSLENSTVRRKGAGYILEDLPDSKNGTSVNWEFLAKGQAHPLQAADVIGVGRSLLVFANA